MKLEWLSSNLKPTQLAATIELKMKLTFAKQPTVFMLLLILMRPKEATSAEIKPLKPKVPTARD